MGSEDKITPSAAATTTTGDGHNHSAQRNVDINPDPVLDYAHEHTHAHVHHATQEKDETMMFATTTPADKYPGSGETPDYKVHPMSSRDDEESGGVGDIRNEEETVRANPWSLKSLYRRFRIVFHLAIWAVWTA